ncbi:MAG: site-specific integrase [Candidatus Dormibacteraeota bacterium]|nr:site-specific integrase [Candidatus Dormibacteraeota bacterium]
MPSSRLALLVSSAYRYAEASVAENTLRSYQADWRSFKGWCEAQAALSLPASPATVVLYVAWLADRGRKVPTIEHQLSAIAQAHQLAGLDAPTQHVDVRRTMKGIRRTLGRTRNAKAALSTAELQRLVATCDPGTLAGLRDRALLVLGFASSCRRSELVAFDVEDIEATDDGLRVQIARSKTDPEGHGREIGVPYGSHVETCPVRTLRAWLQAAGIERGPLFCAVDRHDNAQEGRLTDKGVARIVQRACLRAGLDATKYAGHSLRRGFATTAAKNGAPRESIKRQTGHRSDAILDRYIEAGTLFEKNAAAYLGL